MAHVVVPDDVVHVDGALDARRGVEILRIAPEVLVLVDGAAVTFEVGVVDVLNTDWITETDSEE